VGGALIVRLEVRIEPGLREIAGEHVVIGRAMVRIVVRRANQRKLVHVLGDLRHVFADLNAVHIGRDRLELAAKLDRGLGLEVPGIHRAQPAVQEEKDQRDFLGGFPQFCGLSLQLQQTRQRQTEQAGGPHTQEVAAFDAVTIISSSVSSPYPLKKSRLRDVRSFFYPKAVHNCSSFSGYSCTSSMDCIRPT